MAIPESVIRSCNDRVQSLRQAFIQCLLGVEWPGESIEFPTLQFAVSDATEETLHEIEKGWLTTYVRVPNQEGEDEVHVHPYVLEILADEQSWLESLPLYLSALSRLRNPQHYSYEIMAEAVAVAVWTHVAFGEDVPPLFSTLLEMSL